MPSKLLKTAKKAGRILKKRYFRGKGFGDPKYSTMIKDINFLKSVVNAEKKRLQVYTTSAQTVGQVNGNNGGIYLADVTPLPAQGTSYNQRTGNSIKWHSSHLQFQFTHQSATTQPIKVRAQLVHVLGEPYATVSPNMLEDFLQPNPFVTGGTIYDYYSPRNANSYKTFRVLKTKTFTVKPDQFSGQPMLTSINLGIKLRNHHVKWQNDSTTASAGQVILIITADNGNVSAGTASTLGNGVYTTAVNTALNFQYNYMHYFYDN